MPIYYYDDDIIQGGMIDNTPIGSITPSSGAFTILKLGQNEETLAASKTLIATDKVVQKLDPDGVSRDVTLPVITNDLMFIIYNSGTVATFNLVVKNPAAATLATLGPGMMGIFHCGAAWEWIDDSGIYYDAVNDRVGIGITAPSALLHLQNNTVAVQGVRITSNVNGADDVMLGVRTSDGNHNIGFFGVNGFIDDSGAVANTGTKFNSGSSAWIIGGKASNAAFETQSLFAINY